MNNLKYKIRICISILLLTIPSVLYPQSFNWVKSAGSFGFDKVSNMCTDLSGNIYVAFSGGSPNVYFNSDTLPVSGLNDLFIVKYNSIGNEVWKMKFGGANISTMPAVIEGIGPIVYDSISNSIYISGKYYQSCLIDTFQLTTFPGSSKGFVAKINLNGNCIWAKNFGGNTFTGSGPLLAVDKNGKLQVLFQVYNNSNFDTIAVTPGGYIGKLNSDGTTIYIKKICRLYSQYQRSVYNFEKLEVLNDITYVYGGSYDSLTLDTIVLPNSNYYSLVVSAWDTSGSILWAKQSDHSETGTGTMCMDNSSNMYVLDRFDGPYITFNSDTLFVNSTRGVYLIKFDKYGNLVWHKSYPTGGLGNKGAIVDTEGNVYFTGSFIDSIRFGNFVLYSSTPNEELFIVRFDSSGNCIGVRQAGTATGDDIIENSNGELYVAGTFRNTGTFGNISIPSYGSSDMFLANLSAITGSGGGNERTYNNQLIIYANPNKGSFRIKLPDAIATLQNAFLIVYDQTGREVSRFALDSNSDNPRFEVNSASAGMYTVKLIQEEKVFVGRMVLE